MVAVIQGKEEAGDARYIEFRVVRSPTDPDRILGSWLFADPRGMTVEQNKLGGSAEIEFRYVVDCADQHGIPFVWVNDPEELFMKFNGW